MRVLLKIIVLAVWLCCITIFTISCEQAGEQKMKIKRESFGKLSDGKEVDIFTLRHPDGSEARLTNYGAAVVSLQVPDKYGKIENVVLGFDEIESYEKIRAFYGAIVGRYGNRISKGRFTLDGESYNLPTNHGENSLHGGINGFDRQLWEVKDFNVDNSAFVKFYYFSKDGEEGYPGNLEVTVVYRFTLDHELIIEYEISADQKTVKNVTNHAYFNLSGDVKRDILEQELVLNSEKFTPIDKGLIPTGEIRSVENTPFDFRKSKPIGEDINVENEQLKFGLGYDHNWILSEVENTLKNAGSVYDTQSGRFMEIFTTEPSIQFYSGNFMDGSHAGHSGRVYKYREAMCLETQHYPDSPNHSNFPSTVIHPGKTYKSLTKYKFSTK